MKEVVAALFGVASCTALACLIVFVMQMTIFKKGDWVYTTLNGRGKLTLTQKIYFIFALLGFLICIGGGVYCLLWFIPRSWGGVDEDGDFTSLRLYGSFFSAIFLGGALVSLVLETVTSRWMTQRRLEDTAHLEDKVKVRNDEIRWYRALIEVADDPQRLTSFRNDFRDKLDRLSATEPGYKPEYGQQLKRQLHSDQVQGYTDLLKNVEARVKIQEQEQERKDRLMELLRKEFHSNSRRLSGEALPARHHAD